MSGYVHCACRDCFEIAIASADEPALCLECAACGCDVSGHSTCNSPDAYGGGYDSTDYESDPVDGDTLTAEDE